MLRNRIVRLGTLVVVALVIETSNAPAARATTSWPTSSGAHEAARSVERILVRDGAQLAATVYRPAARGRLPTLVSITPYGRSRLEDSARRFAANGYAVVIVDARGRHDSQGDWDPFSAHHKRDGFDVVEWAAHQPWSNRRVAMWGASFGGWTSWWAASMAPPHLRTIVTLSTPADQFENGPYHYGTLTGGWLPDWTALMSGRVEQRVGQGAYGGWLARREADFVAPYSAINERRGFNMPWVETWYQHNSASDAYWRAIGYQNCAHYSRIKIPTLSVTGWLDTSHTGSIRNYEGMRRCGGTAAARQSRLIVGPWGHAMTSRRVGDIDYGPDAEVDQDALMLRWFDHYLKGVNNGIEAEPSVRLFLMGANRWYDADRWPLPHTRRIDYFLDDGPSQEIGALRLAAPVASSARNYIYDPRNPTRMPQSTPSNGSLDGAVDTRQSVDGGVLVYETEPLVASIDIIGPIETALYAATSATDTDWMVRLVDVYPDGRALLLADGMLRARSRDPADGAFSPSRLSRIAPGRIYAYRIGFWRGTANRFERGHKIRVEISSSWFPYVLPNLNSGEDNLAQVPPSVAVIARQIVASGGRYPSHITLWSASERTDTRIPGRVP